MDIESGGALQQRLRELSERAGSARLADLAGRDWDTVHVFIEGDSADRIKQVAGREVLRDKYYGTAGNLLVFAKGGEVTAAVEIVPDILVTGGRTTWTSAVRIEPRGTRTPVALKLVE